MLTKWAKKILAINNLTPSDAAILLPCTFTTTGAAMIEAKVPNGTTVYLPAKPEVSSFAFIPNALTISGASSSVGVAVGSGNTPATENDYNLEQQITGLSVSSTPNPVAYYDKENWKYCSRLDYAVSNNTGSDVTIKEIGLFRKFYSASTRGNNGSSSARYAVLFDRTVLSQPITIPNGGAATVRYEFVYDA